MTEELPKDEVGADPEAAIQSLPDADSELPQFSTPGATLSTDGVAFFLDWLGSLQWR